MVAIGTDLKASRESAEIASVVSLAIQSEMAALEVNDNTPGNEDPQPQHESGNNRDPKPRGSVTLCRYRAFGFRAVAEGTTFA